VHMCTLDTKIKNDGLIKKGLLGKPELIAKTLYKHHKNPSRILDVGYAQYPNKHLHGEVCGVDIVTDEHPENYTAVHNVDLNTFTLPYDDCYFDAVTMGCVLAHVTNPLGLLSELHRVLKPDGVLVLSSPNPNYYWEQMLNIFFTYFKNRVAKVKFLEHFYEFTRYNMRTIADRAGFEVVDEVGVSFHMVKLGWTFQPLKYPGIAYEIVYALRKNGSPKMYTICELPEGNKVVPTVLR
jgi:ubiquinone/menaquinone biosynthesis C-methylase UbiE